MPTWRQEHSSSWTSQNHASEFCRSKQFAAGPVPPVTVRQQPIVSAQTGPAPDESKLMSANVDPVCPQCQTPLTSRPLKRGASAWTCDGCYGNWISGSDVLKLAKDPAIAKQAVKRVLLSSNPSELDCPGCRKKLVTNAFLKRSMQVDGCRHCRRLWLDDADFHRTLTALANGSRDESKDGSRSSKPSKSAEDLQVFCKNCHTQFKVPGNFPGSGVACQKCATRCEVFHQTRTNETSGDDFIAGFLTTSLFLSGMMIFYAFHKGLPPWPVVSIVVFCVLAIAVFFVTNTCRHCQKFCSYQLSGHKQGNDLVGKTEYACSRCGHRKWVSYDRTPKAAGP